jgi:hypothetical protein
MHIGYEKGILRAGTACLALLLLIVGTTAAADEIYRWVDENGIVNYTQLKPRDTDAEAIVTRAGAARKAEKTAEPAPVATSTPAVTTTTGQPLDEEQQKMLEDLQAAEHQRQVEVARIKEQNCQRSRDVLSRLSVKSRIRVRDENGEHRVMPEDERQDRIAQAQEGIALYCTPA